MENSILTSKTANSFAQGRKFRTQIPGKFRESFRYYLFLRDRKRFPFNLTLHKILVSDLDDLHDHPWSYATLILKGGYFEHTPSGKFWRGPGHFRVCKAQSLHRLELKKDADGNEIPCWSLFVMGQKEQDWGFIRNGEWINNEQYLKEKYGQEALL